MTEILELNVHSKKAYNYFQKHPLMAVKRALFLAGGKKGSCGTAGGPAFCGEDVNAENTHIGTTSTSLTPYRFNVNNDANVISKNIVTTVECTIVVVAITIVTPSGACFQIQRGGVNKTSEETVSAANFARWNYYGHLVYAAEHIVAGNYTYDLVNKAGYLLDCHGAAMKIVAIKCSDLTLDVDAENTTTGTSGTSSSIYHEASVAVGSNIISQTINTTKTSCIVIVGFLVCDAASHFHVERGGVDKSLEETVSAINFAISDGFGYLIFGIETPLASGAYTYNLVNRSGGSVNGKGSMIKLVAVANT